MARNRKRPSSVRSFKDEWKETGLPSPEEVEQAAAELVEQPASSPKTQSQPQPQPDPTPQPKPKTQSKSTKTKTVKKTASQRFTLADAKKTDESVNEKGRVRFNTTIRPELRDMLHRIAKNNGMTISDVMEEILVDYFGITK